MDLRSAIPAVTALTMPRHQVFGRRHGGFC